MSHNNPSNGKKLIFTIFGAGSLGSLVGGTLATRFPVILVGRKPHLSAIREKGLTVSGKSQLQVKPAAIISLDKDGQGFEDMWKGIASPLQLDSFDTHIVIACVKSYQTKNILEHLKFIKEHGVRAKKTFVLSLQNGIENEALLASAVGEESVIGGITTEGITFKEPGHVFHAGKGETSLGPLSMDHGETKETAKLLVDAFNDVGMKCYFCNNIKGKIWTKAIINSSINPITAITRLENGYILERKGLEVLAKRACLEGTAVAEANLIDLACDNTWREVKKVIKATAGNRSSMLQDIENGKRTEIDCICGVIIKYGMRENLNVPTQCMLHTLVKNVEMAGRLKRGELEGRLPGDDVEGCRA